MHIQISLQDGVPIYRQIISQIKYQVASGQLQPGDELPPIRTLAGKLLVNPNTVVRAYRELEVEGMVEKRRGAGCYISNGKSPLARREQRKILAKRADSLLAEARQMGFSTADLHTLLDEREENLKQEQSNGEQS